VSDPKGLKVNEMQIHNNECMLRHTVSRCRQFSNNDSTLVRHALEHY